MLLQERYAAAPSSTGVRDASSYVLLIVLEYITFYERLLARLQRIQPLDRVRMQAATNKVPLSAERGLLGAPPYG
jgi:hypothetical protein